MSTNRGKNKIIGKISLTTSGNSYLNGNNPSPSPNINKIQSSSLTPKEINHKRSHSSNKSKNLSKNRYKIGLNNILTNIQNPKLNNLCITNNNNIKNNNNKNYQQYQTTFINLQKNTLPRFRSLSPKYNRFKQLLPKKTSNKKTLVLDLDETLVHSCCFPFDCPSDVVIQIEQENDIHDIHVLVRPHVEEFLERMSKKFELVIFTASISKYANPLLNTIDRMGYVPFRLFREHCTLINTTFVKDLTRLGRELKDIIILDNNPNAYSLNHYNGFPITSWFDDKNDDELLKITPILEFLSYVPDVRDYIKKIVSHNKVQFDVVKQVITNYKNDLKKNNMPLECRKIFNLLKDEEMILRKSKSSKLNTIKNNKRSKIDKNIYNNNFDKFKNICGFGDFASNSYVFDSKLFNNKNNNCNNCNIKIINNNNKTKRYNYKKKNLFFTKNDIVIKKKNGINTMRYKLSNKKVIENNDKRHSANSNNRNNISDNKNILNSLQQCNNIFNNRRVSANVSCARNDKKDNNKGNSIDKSLNYNNGFNMKLNQSLKIKPKNNVKNQVKNMYNNGNFKLDIKVLREQLKKYEHNNKRDNNLDKNEIKKMRKVFQNKNPFLSLSQKMDV